MEEAAKVLRIISQMVEMLLSDWYQSIHPNVLIVCTACKKPHFTRHQCFQATAEAPLYCVDESRVVLVKDIAPDLTFEDFPEIPLLHENDVLFELDDTQDGKRKILGKGGFGVVFKATLKSSNITVAVKERSLQLPVTLENDLSEFLKETWALRFVVLMFGGVLRCMSGGVSVSVSLGVSL